ncbi:MAG: hypothetical protein J5864_00445 [Oscillospiraceae bacterium]|nr:hypothetical protein [Oscillospiraceae bacterium]
MENIVNRIVEIDNEADRRLTEAEEAGRKRVEDSEKEAKELKENLMARAESRMDKVRSFYRGETETDVNRINDECSQKLKQLDEAFENSHSVIEEKIFRAIVGENVG